MKRSKKISGGVCARMSVSLCLCVCVCVCVYMHVYMLTPWNIQAAVSQALFSQSS